MSEQTQHELTVVARDRGVQDAHAHASSAKVRVRVQRVNLHAPEIYVRPLPEIIEHAHGDIYAIVRVVDRDRGLHGQIRDLEIVDGDPDGHFRVVATGNPGEYNIAVLHLLDREAAPQGYNLTLRASDRGTPMHSAYRVVTVRLADLNDNPPVFDREVYDVQVSETAPVNTPITRIKVTDADAGKNAQCTTDYPQTSRCGTGHLHGLPTDLLVCGGFK
ncbi:Fat-like cadherin-related tumor suppressor-like protein [Frankliniella fusca]|uniref:Fat-like cadherin-related tumor suppressor-like protein n=1 Tax=Frankliniella fusca TaxID=407009 RepID=A0AAE1HIH7_9NEOP|nr:Fat-like cadherin-related tumor suppressor-like protein [Frankliniella fusca]